MKIFYQTIFFIFIIANIFLLEKSFSIETSPSSTSEKKLVILGDSLTEGYGVAKESAFPFLIEKKIKSDGKKWKVINAGVSGSTTASAPSRLKWLLKNKPDLILIILGANDGLRGLKIPDSKKNLKEAIQLISKENIKVVLGGLYMPPNYGQQYTSEFKKMYSDISTEMKIPLIPFILDKVAGDPKLNQIDGIHPNEEGHKIIADTIFQSLKEYLK